MKLVLKDTRTDKIIVELLDNLEEELSDKEVQELITGLDFDIELMDYIYADYI